MQKVYVLLRGEKQTGPYSLEEIIQFDLKPYDLIWIEGKSAGWYYPQEIGDLHPYLSFLPKKPVSEKATTKNVFVSLPSEPKKEEPQPASVPVFLTPSPEVTHRPLPGSHIEEEVHALFNGPAVKERSQANGSSAIRQKKKTPGSFSVVMIAVFIVGGVFAASWVMNMQPKVESDVYPETTVSEPAAEVETTAVAKPGTAQKAFLSSTPRQKQQSRSIASKQTTSTGRQVIVIREQETVSGNTGSESVEEQTPSSTEEVIITEEPTTTPNETPAQQPKKKKLRDKILDIFRKDDNEPAKKSEPAKEENGERRPVYRENTTELARMVHVRFDIPNNWMMGVKGAKATLVNRSNETINKATVELSYFDDDNQLLQKKTVSFGKIDGKGTQTISIPDHPTATKVDYEIVSVTGRPAA